MSTGGKRVGSTCYHIGLVIPDPGAILGSVARKLRAQYPGAIYHAMNRGDRREAIFRDDTDRWCFVEILAQACDKAGWQVHAYYDAELEVGCSTARGQQLELLVEPACGE